jgi:hypothetical protein
MSIEFIAALIGIFTFLIFIFAIDKANPKFIFRPQNQKSRIDSLLLEKSGVFYFGISTTKKETVIIKEVGITIKETSKLNIHSSKEYEFKHIPNTLDIKFVRKIEEEIKNKHFVIYVFDYSLTDNEAGSFSYLEIEVTGTVDPSNWSFPFSMFSHFPRKSKFELKLIYSPDQKGKVNEGFQLASKESASLMGESAKKSTMISSEQIDGVKVTEFFDNNSYRKTTITTKKKT